MKICEKSRMTLKAEYCDPRQCFRQEFELGFALLKKRNFKAAQAKPPLLEWDAMSGTVQGRKGGR